MSQPNVTWEEEDVPLANEYGIHMYKMLYEGQEPDKGKYLLTLEKDGKEEFVQVVGKFYYPVPNQVVLNIADEIAREVNANPMLFDSPQWAKKQQHKHVMKDDIRLRAFYKYGEVEVKPGDKVNFGVSVINSIDMSMRLGMTGFTYRPTCANMVLFGHGTLKKFRQATVISKAQAREIGHGFHGEVINQVIKRHTRGNFPSESEVERVFGYFDTVIDALTSAIEVYKHLTQIKLNKEIATQLTQNTHRKNTPSYIELPKQGQTGVQNLKQHPTLWKTYNDITANIWHNEQGSLQYRQTQFDNLHESILTITEEQ